MMGGPAMQPLNATSFLPDASVAKATSVMQPSFVYARSFPAVAVLNDTVDHYPTFYAMFHARGDAMFGEKATGINALLGSRLIPRTMFQSDRGVDLLSSTLVKFQEDLTQIWSEAGFLSNLSPAVKSPRSARRICLFSLHGAMNCCSSLAPSNGMTPYPTLGDPTRKPNGS